MLSALIDSRSRWLVGSSNTRTLGFCSISLQKISRAASPPERTSVFLSPSSNFLVGGSRLPLMKPLESRHARLDQRFVVLGKISNRRFVTPDNLSVGEK